MLLCRFDDCVERQLVSFDLLLVAQVLRFDADVVLHEKGALFRGDDVAVVLML